MTSQGHRRPTRMGLLGQEPTLTTTESATYHGGPPLLQGLSQNSTSTLQPSVKGLGPRTQGSAPAPTPTRAPGSEAGGPGRGSRHLQFTLQRTVQWQRTAGAEAVEGPLPAGHRGPGSRLGAHRLPPAHSPLLLPPPAWALGNRYASSRLMGFTVSIFNEASQPTYQNPPVHLIPESSGAWGGGARPLVTPCVFQKPLLSPGGLWGRTGWVRIQRDQVTDRRTSPGHHLAQAPTASAAHHSTQAPLAVAPLGLIRPVIPPNNRNPGSSRSLCLSTTVGTQSRNGLEIAQNTPEDKAIFQAGMYQGPGIGWEV